MKKNYYQTLPKDEKEKIKKAYIKEYNNSDIKIRLKSLLIYTIIGYLFAISLIFYTIFYETNHVGSIVIIVTLFILSTIFLIGRYIVKLRLLNKIALKKK